MAYSDEQKQEFLRMLVATDFDIKNSTIEFNYKYNKDKPQLHRSTVYDWLKKDKDFKLEFDTLIEELLDESEKMHRLLRRGIPIYNEETKEIIAWQEKPDRAALEFYMKMKGRERGYIEKLELDNKHSGQIDLTQITGIEIKK